MQLPASGAVDLKFDSQGAQVAIAVTNRTVQIYDINLHKRCSVGLPSPSKEADFFSNLEVTWETDLLKRPGLSFVAAQQGSATSLAFDPTGRRLAVGSTTGVHVIDLDRCAVAETHFIAGAPVITSVLYGRSLLSAATVEGAVFTWDVRKPKQPAGRLLISGDVAARLTRTRDEGMLLALTDTGRAHLIDIDQRKVRGTFAFFPDRTVSDQ